MKIILGDNQFFGVNHFDLEKGAESKRLFDSTDKITAFIREALNIGMDGFMINSNDDGFKIISQESFKSNKEIHYSIPYAHKYANMVNEKGMMSLFSHVMKNTSVISNLIGGMKLIVQRDLKHLIPLAIDLEVPKQLPKGSYVYLQNIITDLVIGLGRYDLLAQFITSVQKKGYKPGIVTLNPIMLNEALLKHEVDTSEMIMCFNINDAGFNVFPNKSEVELFAKASHPFKKMGMSIFSSGAGNIPQSIKYVKSLNLDYVVFGSSKMTNLQKNIEAFDE